MVRLWVLLVSLLYGICYCSSFDVWNEFFVIVVPLIVVVLIGVNCLLID